MGSVFVQEDAGKILGRDDVSEDQAHLGNAGIGVANLTLGSVRDTDEVKKKSSTQVEVDFMRSTRQNLELDA
jgi:hypothetical protein